MDPAGASLAEIAAGLQRVAHERQRLIDDERSTGWQRVVTLRTPAHPRSDPLGGQQACAFPESFQMRMTWLPLHDLDGICRAGGGKPNTLRRAETCLVATISQVTIEPVGERRNVLR